MKLDTETFGYYSRHREWFLGKFRMCEFFLSKPISSSQQCTMLPALYTCTAHALLQTPADMLMFFYTQQLCPALHVSTCCVSISYQLLSHETTTPAASHEGSHPWFYKREQQFLKRGWLFGGGQLKKAGL